MHHRSLTILFSLAAGLLAISGVAAGAEPADRVDFNRDIKPIFAATCYACHGPEKARGGLRRVRARNGQS